LRLALAGRFYLWQGPDHAWNDTGGLRRATRNKSKGIAMKNFLAVHPGSAAGVDAWKNMDEDLQELADCAVCVVCAGLI
jgi:hypothetical protein